MCTALNSEQCHSYKSAESQYDPEGMFIQGKAITTFWGESSYIRSMLHLICFSQKPEEMWECSPFILDSYSESLKIQK